MATFLVQKRADLGDDGIKWPGDVVELDEADNSTDILISRRFVVPVPADYKGGPQEAEAAPDPAPNPEAAGGNDGTDADAGDAKTPAAEGEGDDNVDPAESDDYKSLMAMTRDKLNSDAADLGIEGAEAMANKAEVARAILNKLNEGQ